MRMAGIGTAVIFQIELAIPGIDIAVCLCNRFLQLTEIFACGSRLHMRQSRNLIQSAALLQHITVDTAAAISVTIGKQQVMIHFLFAVSVPDTLDGTGLNQSVIGIEPAVSFSPGLRRRNKVGQHFAAIDAFPVKRIMRHTVVLVPADFCRHKHVDAGFFQDLGECPGIAEYIRQPQKFYFLAEFILDEFAAD